jgi:hypothetical protein
VKSSLCLKVSWLALFSCIDEGIVGVTACEIGRTETNAILRGAKKYVGIGHEVVVDANSGSKFNKKIISWDRWLANKLSALILH